MLVLSPSTNTTAADDAPRPGRHAVTYSSIDEFPNTYQQQLLLITQKGLLCIAQ
jgi:hypothetical protein